MRHMNKKTKIMIITCFIALSLIVTGICVVVIRNRNNDISIQEPIEVNGIEQIFPLTEGNSSQAAELIKSNIIKVVNKIIESVRLDVYAGWNNNNVTGVNVLGVPLNDEGLRFLKSYSFAPSHSYGMPLTELRLLLNEEDYEGGLYEGADLTVCITFKTRKQGSFTQIMPWGLSK